MNDIVIDHLSTIIPEDRILRDENMSAHTTFRAGGPAKVLLVPENRKELSDVLNYLDKEGAEHIVIGNGSNLLVGDRGYDGVCIELMSGFKGIEVDGCRITAEAGELLSRVADTALQHSLTGFEFASGIPGTVGGAIVMNAGAYGGEMKDIVSSVEVMTPDGKLLTLSGEDMGFAYRDSIVRKSGFTVLKTVFELSPGNREEIRNRMDELARSRKEKQPLEFPSAGSTFKRPEGYFAGKLIMDAGLSGYCIGGAKVSEKHCGFIINSGGASARDIYDLIGHVKNRVYEEFGVELEPEVFMIGEF